MKKIISISLALLLLLSLWGCGNSHDSIAVPAEFYYRNATASYNSDSAVICGETRESSGHDLTDIVNIYLQGPITPNCLSPFPAGVTVVSVDQRDDRLYIVLSSPFDTLSGIDLTLACACLSKTMMELTQCNAVEISVPNASLNGKSSIIIDEQSLLLLDSSF